MFWRFFGDVSESCFEVVFFENFLGGAAEDHLKCKTRGCLFALLAPSMFYHCLENLGGVGVVV